MRAPVTFRKMLLCAAAILLLAAAAVAGQSQQPPPASPAELDRVVAVVNNRAILSSDIADEMRLSVLDPNNSSRNILAPQRALQQLIGRTIIQQQIREQDLQSSEPSPKDVQDRLMEIRKELPACIRQNCTSEAGWTAFLAKNGLTQIQVENYLQLRLQILAFIESRFRQGIRISQEEIETYYQKTLVPQYAKGDAVPPLTAVAPRIEEILLQQQVNLLFGSWLENLRKQGDVEVLDPTLETAGTPANESGAR